MSVIALHFIWQSTEKIIFFNISKIPFHLLIFFTLHSFCFTHFTAEFFLPNFLGSSIIHFVENHIEMTCIECFVACQQLLLYEYYNWHFLRLKNLLQTLVKAFVFASSH